MSKLRKLFRWTAALYIGGILVSHASERVALTGDLTLYIATDGDDANACENPSSPCLTLQSAVEKLRNDYDLQSRLPVIKIADGTYPQSAPLKIHDKPVGWLQIAIEGNCSNPENVTLRLDQSSSSVIEARDYGTVTVRCLTLESGSGQTNNTAFDASQFSTIDVGNVRIGDFSTALLARQQGNINCVGDLTATGAAYDQFFFASANSTIVCGGNTKVTHEQATHYRVAFYRAMMNATIDAFPQFIPTGENAASGVRCSIQDFSILNTHGAGDTIPGDGECVASDSKVY